MQSRNAYRCGEGTSNATAGDTCRWWSRYVMFGDVGEYFASAEKDDWKALTPDDQRVSYRAVLVRGEVGMAITTARRRSKI